MTKDRRQIFEAICKNRLESKYRRDQEYGRYLDRWLHGIDVIVDGQDYKTRMNDSEPMPYNIYFS